MDRRRGTGREGERLAAEHLRRRGWRIVERNARTARGELDLIALDGVELVFVEVKALRAGTTAGPGSPLEAVGPNKRRQIRRLAREWLAGPTAASGYAAIRFDAIGIVIGADGTARIEHVRAAF